jgi:hypothetical protein
MRMFLVFVLLLVASASAAVFEAASTSEQLVELAAEVDVAPNPNVSLALAERAGAITKQSWGLPLVWHAGAIDAYAAIQADVSNIARDEGGRRETSFEAINFSERAVRLSPVLPSAWYRLAAFDAVGLKNPLCGAVRCLELSFASAHITPQLELGCDRLRLARALGIRLEPKSIDVRSFVKSASRKNAATCLSALNGYELFRILLGQ